MSWSARGWRRWRIGGWRRSSKTAPSSRSSPTSPPETIREAVFTAAAEARKRSKAEGPSAPRSGATRSCRRSAQELGLVPEKVAESLFADLKDENRLLDFKDLTAERLVDRYNVALAQSVLLRSVRATVEVRGEKPARYRQLFRQIKFHRLLAEGRGDRWTRGTRSGSTAP